MAELSCALFQHLLSYIDQLPDLIRASFVCHYWRSCITDDEHFLNQWFHRSLKFSRESPLNGSAMNEYQRELTQNIDRSVSPTNFRSSQCYVLQVIDPFYVNTRKDFFEQQYPESFFDGYYSFSFWLFLPRQCEMNVRIGTTHVLDLHHCHHTDKQYGFRDDKQTLFDNQWIHLVITNSESQSGYCKWINAQNINSFNLHQTFNSHLSGISRSNAITITCKRINYSIESPVEARIADLAAFKRCLSTIEIRAIYQQQKCIDKVQIGTYMINRRKITSNSI
ncbi:unnamed protein product [Adineta ricciae]|uniref:F-box domain-containing protein n=1 Tax=Adineta ricciae TaxID=249248 RepID=A0A816A496_ADIRI|nr:unnamed protein product [Adineta ricciae]CAF1591120.1 unnamed protein product [Adineta ricciae]